MDVHKKTLSLSIYFSGVQMRRFNESKSGRISQTFNGKVYTEQVSCGFGQTVNYVHYV